MVEKRLEPLPFMTRPRWVLVDRWGCWLRCASEMRLSMRSSNTIRTRGLSEACEAVRKNGACKHVDGEFYLCSDCVRYVYIWRRIACVNGLLRGNNWEGRYARQTPTLRKNGWNVSNTDATTIIAYIYLFIIPGRRLHLPFFGGEIH